MSSQAHGSRSARSHAGAKKSYDKVMKQSLTVLLALLQPPHIVNDTALF
jgi:hypothetical protein